MVYKEGNELEAPPIQIQFNVRTKKKKKAGCQFSWEDYEGVYWLSQWGVCLVLCFQSWSLNRESENTLDCLNEALSAVCVSTHWSLSFVSEGGRRKTTKVRKSAERRTRTPAVPPPSFPSFILPLSPGQTCSPSSSTSSSSSPPLLFQLPSLSFFFLLIFLPAETQNPCNPPDPGRSRGEGKRREPEGWGKRVEEEEEEGKVNEEEDKIYHGNPRKYPG